MVTRNVVLTDRHEQVIKDLVGSGRYQNASEVLRDGLRLIEERDTREQAKLQALKEAARLGFAEIDEGRYTEIASDDIGSYIDELGESAAQPLR